MQPMVTLGGAPALARFQHLDTEDPEEARHVVGRIFCPHFLAPAERRPQGFRARHYSVRQAGYSVNRVAYGARVEIDPGELGRFFLLQIPLTGSARVRCGRDEAVAEAGRSGTLLSPTLATRMTWSEACEKIIILLNRAHVEAFHSHLGGAAGPVELPLGLDFTRESGSALLQHAKLMVETADRAAPAPAAYQATLRDGLVALLLDGLVSRMEAREAVPASPASVRRAEDHVLANLDKPLAMADLAAAAGVGLRSLQESFKRSRGLTLSEWIQNARLERFRQSLLVSDGSISVTQLALAAGLGHLGRAAAAYRTRYGETPSQTLRRVCGDTRDTGSDHPRTA